MERKTIGTENLKLIVNILISLVILLLCIFFGAEIGFVFYAICDWLDYLLYCKPACSVS